MLDLKDFKKTKALKVFLLEISFVNVDLKVDNNLSKTHNIAVHGMSSFIFKNAYTLPFCHISVKTLRDYKEFITS